MDEDRIEVTAQLNMPLMTVERGQYESALQDTIGPAGLGEVVGGGTMMKKSGEIEYIDVHVLLADPSRNAPILIAILEAFGAPKGSVLRVATSDGAEETPFGKTEGVAIYLDGVGLPEEVYATSDVNYVVAQLNARLEGVGEMRCSWEGPTETALYFYGADAEAIKARVADFLMSYALCAGARVVTVAPPVA